MIKRTDYRFTHSNKDDLSSSSSEDDDELESATEQSSEAVEDTDGGEESCDTAAEEDEEDNEREVTSLDSGEEDIPREWLLARGLNTEIGSRMASLRARGHRDSAKVRNQWAEAVEEAERSLVLRKGRKNKVQEDFSDEDLSLEADTSDEPEEDSEEEGGKSAKLRLKFQLRRQNTKFGRTEEVVEGGNAEDKSKCGGVAEGRAGGDLAAKGDSVFNEEMEVVMVKVKGVLKCAICPSIVCLSEESMRAHVKSKRHARSSKKLAEGRLTRWLNSDGEEEEEAETHAERYARQVKGTTLATMQEEGPENPAKSKKQRLSGRQRQRKRQLLMRKSSSGGVNGIVKSNQEGEVRKKERKQSRNEEKIKDTGVAGRERSNLKDGRRMQAGANRRMVGGDKEGLRGAAGDHVSGRGVLQKEDLKAVGDGTGSDKIGKSHGRSRERGKDKSKGRIEMHHSKESEDWEGTAGKKVTGSSKEEARRVSEDNHQLLVKSRNGDLTNKKRKQKM